MPLPITSSQKRIFGIALLAGAMTLLFWAWPRTEAKSEPPSILLPPQVEFVGVLRSAADVSPKPGLFKKILKKIAGIDDRDKAMLLPHGVAVDDQGRVLVADTRERVVHIFDAERKKYKTLRAPDKDPFIAPIAIALDGAGQIYVTDSGRSRIFRFTAEGKFSGTIGGIDKNESIFKRCTGLAIDKQRGRIYVVDTIAMQIVVLDMQGKVLQRFGKPGDGPGEFNYPTHIALDRDGSLWVMDSLNFRVQHLDRDGGVLSAFGRLGDGIGEFDKPKGITLDAQGRIFVVEGRNDRVQVYDPTGRLLFFFGRTGSNEGDFFLPTGIAVDARDRVYVSDGYNRRVQIFQLKADVPTTPQPAAEVAPATGGGQ